MSKYSQGMTGVYYAAAALSEKGYIVTITTRNAPIADILIATPDMKKLFSVQVKASKYDYFLMSKRAKKDKSPNLIYILVSLKKDKEPVFYIVKSSVVATNICKNKKGWYWFEPIDRDRDNWKIIR